jgi:excisionase family DNA binding protein
MAVASNEDLLTPAEVAALFHVNTETVSRWATAGKISSIKTLGGHRRYRASEIRGLSQSSEWTREVDITNAQSQTIDIRDRRRKAVGFPLP